MIGNSVVNAGFTMKQDVYNGQPCMRRVVNPVTSTATVAGCSGCMNGDNLPLCTDLENAVKNNTASSKLDPINWIKTNPLLAGGVAIAAYFLLFKK